MQTYPNLGPKRMGQEDGKHNQQERHEVQVPLHSNFDGDLK